MRISNRKKMIVSRFVTRLPQTDWRMQSSSMVLQKEIHHFTKKTKENFITLLIMIIGMATALTWSDVVKTVIDIFFIERSALFVKVYVAIIVTIITLILTYMISRARENGYR